MLNFSEFFNIQGWIWINLILTSEKWQNPFQYIWFFTDDIIGIQNGPNDEKHKPPQFHVFSCFYFFSVINAFLASQLSQKLQDEISDELSKVRFFYEFDLVTWLIPESDWCLVNLLIQSLLPMCAFCYYKQNISSVLKNIWVPSNDICVD